MNSQTMTVYFTNRDSDIHDMGDDYNMIAFNGQNHFYYLKKKALNNDDKINIKKLNIYVIDCVK